MDTICNYPNRHGKNGTAKSGAPWKFTTRRNFGTIYVKRREIPLASHGYAAKLMFYSGTVIAIAIPVNLSQFMSLILTLIYGS
jgi:hypothetical protein